MIVYFRDGVMYPSLRRQFYFFPCFVFLICSLPFTIFKVRSRLISRNLPNASPTALRPFVLFHFKVPLLGPSLFGLKGAGSAYDQLGQLRTPMSADELDEKWEREQGEHKARGIRGEVAKDTGWYADKRAKGYERLSSMRSSSRRSGLRADADADVDADVENTEARGDNTAEEKAAGAIQARIRGRLSRRQVGAPQSQCTRSTHAVGVPPPAFLPPPSSPRRVGRPSLKLPKILNFHRPLLSPRR